MIATEKHPRTPSAKRGAPAGSMLMLFLAALGSPHIHQASADTLWDNGIVPDGRFSRALSPPALPNIRVAEDLVIPEPDGWTIRTLRATVGEAGGWSSGSEITIYVRADGDGPGELLREVVGGFARLATGDQYFGMSSYEYVVDGLEIDLCPGTYWIGLRNHQGSGSGTNYWLSSDGGLDGPRSDTGWYSTDEGRNWIAEGDGWRHAFVIEGTASTVCGACCLAEGACEQLSRRECAGRHGLYRRNGAPCATAACPAETRACCLGGDLCIDTSAEECNLLGGGPGPIESDCRDENDNGRSDACEDGCVRAPAWVCDGDVDGDGQVNPVDSGLVQAAFGSSDEQDLCNYDMDCDGQINPVDSGIVQSLFGTCDAPRDVCP
jgi:hypothetical protein